MTNKQKVLFIANKPAYPKIDGGSIAISKLVESFEKINYRIDIVSISKSNYNNLNTPEYYKPSKNINQYTFQKKMKINLVNVINSIINNKSIQAQRFYDSRINKYIQNLIDNSEYKTIIFESIFSTIYLEKLKFNKDTKLILRAHNIEHEIWFNSYEKNPVKKIIFYILGMQIKKMELNIPKFLDYIFTISKNDFIFFEKIFPNKTKLIPVFFKTKNIKTKKISKSIVHLGSMDWKPNIEGIDWFTKNVISKVNKNDKFKIYIAGNKMPKKYLKAKFKNTFISGKVENALDYISNKEILFVPIFSGSGIRIKILEAMAIGIAVISTQKGAQGIPYKNGHDIIIANSAEDFYKYICLLTKNREMAIKIGKNGKRLIEKYFCEKEILKNLNDLV